jgi:hypothetical protein
MAEAVPRHLALRKGPVDGLVGPFLCPTSRLAELQGTLGPDQHVRIGLIVDTGPDSLPDRVAVAGGDGRFDLAMVEVPVPGGPDLVDEVRQVVGLAPPAVGLFVELPRREAWTAALDVLSAAGERRGAKLRTGGPRADLFPTEAEVAGFIEACARRGLAFKCTAGLHQAVRHTDASTGFEHHGFLNILVATCRAVGGGDVRGAIAERDANRLAAEAAATSDETARAARRLFVSYGSCSIDEPLSDLRALGLLPGSA